MSDVGSRKGRRRRQRWAEEIEANSQQISRNTQDTDRLIERNCHLRSLLDSGERPRP